MSDTGTCQVCFGTYRTLRGSDGPIARHGYRRPGWGHEVGRCLGAGYQSFEFSTDRTAWFRDSIVSPRALASEALLGRLARNEVEELLFEKRESFGKRTLVTIRKGDEAQGARYGLGYIPSFEERRRDRIEETKTEIQADQNLLAYINRKLRERVTGAPGHYKAVPA